MPAKHQFLLLTFAVLLSSTGFAQTPGKALIIPNDNGMVVTLEFIEIEEHSNP